MFHRQDSTFFPPDTPRPFSSCTHPAKLKAFGSLSLQAPRGHGSTYAIVRHIGRAVGDNIDSTTSLDSTNDANFGVAIGAEFLRTKSCGPGLFDCAIEQLQSFVGDGFCFGVAVLDDDQMDVESPQGECWVFLPHTAQVKHGRGSLLNPRFYSCVSQKIDKSWMVSQLVEKTRSGVSIGVVVDGTTGNMAFTVDGAPAIDSGLSLPKAARPYLRLRFPGEACSFKLCSLSRPPRVFELFKPFGAIGMEETNGIHTVTNIEGKGRTSYDGGEGIVVGTAAPAQKGRVSFRFSVSHSQENDGRGITVGVAAVGDEELLKDEPFGECWALCPRTGQVWYGQGSLVRPSLSPSQVLYVDRSWKLGMLGRPEAQFSEVDVLVSFDRSSGSSPGSLSFAVNGAPAEDAAVRLPLHGGVRPFARLCFLDDTVVLTPAVRVMTPPVETPLLRSYGSMRLDRKGSEATCSGQGCTIGKVELTAEHSCFVCSIDRSRVNDGDGMLIGVAAVSESELKKDDPFGECWVILPRTGEVKHGRGSLLNPNFTHATNKSGWDWQFGLAGRPAIEGALLEVLADVAAGTLQFSVNGVSIGDAVCGPLSQPLRCYVRLAFPEDVVSVSRPSLPHRPERPPRLAIAHAVSQPAPLPNLMSPSSARGLRTPDSARKRMAQLGLTSLGASLGQSLGDGHHPVPHDGCPVLSEDFKVTKPSPRWAPPTLSWSADVPPRSAGRDWVSRAQKISLRAP